MTIKQPDERQVLRSIWQESPSKDRGLKTGQYVRRSAYVALLLISLVSLLALVTDVSNYISSIKSARGLRLEIASLRVIDDDNPRALIRFRVRNDSPLEIKVERYLFVLYLNGERVGSSYSTYLGTDPDVDPATYIKAQNIDQVLGPRQNLDLEFALYIYSAQMESVRWAQRSGPMSWLASASFTTFLPYSHEENVVRLRARLEE